MNEIRETSPLALVPPPAGGLPVGQLIPGYRYRVLARIGEGGMGTVYAAEHVDLEKRVAIKVLRNDAAHTQKAVERLRDEARAASKIGSQYICDVTDFGQIPDGRVFFVMELLDGQSLGRLLKATPQLSAERALPILRQMCKAFGAAHEKGIVHLDVKPDNVMLVPRGKRTDAVKVVDFGVSALLASARAGEKVVSGTPEYMAPERYLGRAYDHRADIYSLGVLAYEMLAGGLPFEGDTAVATLTMHVRQEPPPLQERALQVPAALASVIAQMLQKDPAARPASMAVVEALLCEAQITSGLRTAWDDLELPAVDDVWQHKLAERMSRPWDKRRKLIVAGAVATALLTGSLALYFFMVRKIEPVFVQSTQTEEVPGVGPWLEKAQIEARREHYTEPFENSALYCIERAEAQNAETQGVKGPLSPGAERLRQTYAGALAIIANELLKAHLRELAVDRFREALLFTPRDPALQGKADLSTEEQKSLVERPREIRAPRAVRSAAQEGTEKARALASELFMSALEGRMSEARLKLKLLDALPEGTAQRAKLADAIRTLALEDRVQGKFAEARALFGLVADLDPADLDARKLATQSDVSPPPKIETKPPAVAVAVADPTKALRKKPMDDEVAETPRNPALSKTATAEGRILMGRGRFTDAIATFNRAVAADPNNAAAHAGLAESHFEKASYTEGLDSARKAMRLAPKNAEYLRLVADLYFKLYRFQEALTGYQRALALAPDDPTLPARIKQVKTKLGQ